MKSLVLNCVETFFPKEKVSKKVPYKYCFSSQKFNNSLNLMFKKSMYGKIKTSYYNK